MEMNYFKDPLFVLINESLLLEIKDIITKDREDKFLILLKDGTVFEFACRCIVSK